MKNLYLILFCGLLFAATTGVSAQPKTYSCGDKVIATLTDGVLTISGSGEMDDFTFDGGSVPHTSNVPWWNERVSITEVIIDNEITSIGKYAFLECTELSSVIIPASIIDIGYGAFWDCTKLISITIGCLLPPDIVDDVFQNINKELVGLFVPEGLEGDYATTPVWENFHIVGYSSTPNGTCGDDLEWEYDMNGTLTISGSGDMEDYSTDTPAPWKIFSSKIHTLVLPDDLTYIGQHAFESCTRLTAVTIPDGVAKIGQFAFNSCEGLTSVSIPGSVTEIQDRAFSRTGLISVTIPGSVSIIGFRAFYHCTELTSVTVEWDTPPSTGIDQDLFQDVDVKNVKLIVPAGAVAAYKDDPVWGNFDIQEPVEDISLNKRDLSLVVGESEKLEVIFDPEDATNQNVTWKTSDENIAMVDEDGTVKAIAVGIAIITVTSEDGGFSDECEVTVIAATVTGIEVTTQPKLTYNDGDVLDLSKLVVTLAYSNNTSEEITFEDFEEYGLETAPINGVTLSLENNGETVTVKHTETDESATTDELTVLPVVTKVEIITQPKLEYIEGNTLDLSDLVVELTFSDDTKEAITFDEFEEYGLTTDPDDGIELTLGDNGAPITVTHTASGESDTTDELTVIAATVVEVSIKTQPKLIYTEEEALNLSKLVVTLTYDNDKTKDVAFEDFGKFGLEADPANGAILTLDDNGTPVTVTLAESELFAITGNLTVNSTPTLTKVAIKTQPKLTYTEGDALDLSALAVTLTYSDESAENVAFENFDEFGLTTYPTDGAILALTHDGKPVTVTHTESKLSAATNNLTVDPEIVTVTKVEIKTQPKLTYSEKEALDLSDLVVTMTYSNSTTDEVAFTAFGTNGLTTSPANGTTLALTHNGTPVTVTHTESDKSAATGNLTVTKVTSAEIIDKPLAKTYPNPTDGLFTLQFENPGTYSVTITTMSGAILFRQIVNDQIKQMDISSLPFGAYLLLIDDGKQKSITKIVKY